MYLITALSLLAALLPTQALAGPKSSIGSNLTPAQEGSAAVTWLWTRNPLLAARQNYILCGGEY